MKYPSITKAPNKRWSSEESYKPDAYVLIVQSKYILIVILSLLLLMDFGMTDGYSQHAKFQIIDTSLAESLRYRLWLDSYIKTSSDTLSINVFSKSAISYSNRFYVRSHQVFPSAFNRETDLMKSCTFQYTPKQVEMFKDELYRRMMILNPQMMMDRGTGRHWRPVMINIFGF